ncbi:apoptosis-inducing factor 3-like isoform X2 [Bacillus rossius redtenbacheri]|uniref:apoptosis-inducing factor 3-like isoform X2 n=1 Tax=Bacillus rossius redtenbacheri TaxID=93214 RepID=UPI002FDEAC44
MLYLLIRLAVMNAKEEEKCFVLPQSASSLEDNVMKVIEIPTEGSEKQNVLLVKQNGIISALSAKCTHYGAPMKDGVLGDGRIRCPWHGACFNSKTGDIEDGPGLDCLQSFRVEVNENAVSIWYSRSKLAEQKRIKEMVAGDPNIYDSESCVVIGGGAAGSACVEGLRQEGFRGRIVLCSDEPYHPYDRIKISKLINAKIDTMLLRKDSFYKEHDIEVLTNDRVLSVDDKNCTVHLNSGTKLHYSHLFIASGCNSRKPSYPGIELNNIFYLRNFSDKEKISVAVTENVKLVILGTSFIGMEMASFYIGKVKQITVIGSIPFRRTLGTEIGLKIKKMLEAKGVTFILNNLPSKLTSGDKNDGILRSLVLTDGTVVEADVLLIAIGSVPATDFLKTSNIKLAESGHVIVNKYLETNVANVFAGGDVAIAPLYDGHSTCGHWQLAQYCGKLAAKNLVHKNHSEISTVPFFWTKILDTNIRCSGVFENYDRIQLSEDDENEKNFIAHFCKNGKIYGVAASGSKASYAIEFAEKLAVHGPTLDL